MSLSLILALCPILGLSFCLSCRLRLRATPATKPNPARGLLRCALKRQFYGNAAASSFQPMKWRVGKGGKGLNYGTKHCGCESTPPHDTSSCKRGRYRCGTQ